MKLQIVSGGLLFLLLGILCSGCRREAKEFAFHYTVESVDTYKFILTLRSDSTYRLEKYNYYMDNFERKQRPVVFEGRMPPARFGQLQKLLEESDLFSLKDAYGFQDEKSAAPASSGLIYQVDFQSEGKEKFITWQEGARLPLSFIRLLQFMNTFLSGV